VAGEVGAAMIESRKVGEGVSQGGTTTGCSNTELVDRQANKYNHPGHGMAPLVVVVVGAVAVVVESSSHHHHHYYYYYYYYHSPDRALYYIEREIGPSSSSS